MCGIAGRTTVDGRPLADQVGRMVRALSHRGPDAQHVWSDPHVALGHARLAIIDLSRHADQPMEDATGRHVIVFNGEIYNFKEIRSALEERGVRFRTSGDTEVLLEAYRAWGGDCLSRLNGMFAFAIWDRVERTLFLARDRLGKKPLYYYETADGGLAFASELKALRTAADAPREINPRALSQYLTHAYVLTSESIIKTVRKLEPGHWLMHIPGKPLRRGRYWDLAASFRDKRRHRSFGEAEEELRALIDDSVRLRLVGDVPLGAFLSGGVDSSTIVAAMCRLGDPRNVKTFSIGFAEKNFDERSHARRVADLLGIDHFDRVVTPDIAAVMPRIFYFADEPFADTSVLPTYELAEITREKVVVALSGDGGDELFAGYTTYMADRVHHWTNWLPTALVRPLKALVGWLPPSHGKIGLDYKLRQFLAGHGLDGVAAHAMWRTMFSESEKRVLVQPEWRDAVLGCDPIEDFRRYEADVADCHYIDRMMYVDIKTWLADDILVKVDRATMAHSLEARCPLLDYRLAEFAASLPVDYKLKGLRAKHILKFSQRNRLPADILHRPKEGFSAPTNRWLAEPGKGLFSALDSADLAGEFFSRAEVERLCQEHWGHRRDNGFKLMVLLGLHFWQASDPDRCSS